jgi:hypothetical protein
MGTETEGVFAELLDELSKQHRRLVTELSGPDDEQTLLEAHKWLLSILQVATDTQLWADPAHPRFIEIVGPYKKWGGDNADAFYCFAPVDPNRTYEVKVKRGDAVYLSLTVYGGPKDGHYSERIVGSLNDRQAPPDPDGLITMVLSQTDPGDGTPWIKLAPDAVAIITRDYLNDPDGDARAVWHISTPSDQAAYRETDADLARRFRAALTWLRDQSAMVPLALGEPNTIDPPYPVPTTTFGWAAGDAAYAMGSYALDDGQALVVRGTSPPCAFWNLCLWNPFLHTYNYDYERVTINGAQVAYEDDGSWEIVIAPTDTGHRNWVSTAGHHKGRIWFRWFLPDETPAQPTVEVVQLESATGR